MEAAIRALAEPRRRRILQLVRDGELTAGEIADEFEVTRPAISQHLTVLKRAGLVAERRDGTRRLYRARVEGLAGLREFLDEYWGWEGAEAEGGHAVPPGSSRVEVSLEPDGDGTLVRLRHLGLPEEALEIHGQGWDLYLGRLVVAGAGGDPGPDPSAKSE